MQTMFRNSNLLLQRQANLVAPVSQRRTLAQASRMLRNAEEPASRKHHAQTAGTRLARLKNSEFDVD
ncbi:hypothetical protein PYCC9005_005269 [Savitreella phatthalungensis]